MWLDGSEDGIVQEYSHDGRELSAADRQAGRFRFLGRHRHGHAFKFELVAVLPSVGNRIRSAQMATFMSPTGMPKERAAIIFASWCLITERVMLPPVEVAQIAEERRRGGDNGALRPCEQ